ncbi:hypothetical protein T439DRAFT_342782 [Meredithblackwellia eburnea MCA 4105]
MVVGAPEIKLSKKMLAAQKKAQALPAMSKAGQDPAATTVEKPAATDSKDSGRPDKAAYDAEQEKFKKEIDALQAKSNEVRAKIAASSGKGPQAERKQQLRAELDGLRNEQQNKKGGRAKTFEQVKALQEGLSKKIKDLQAAKSKLPYKTTAEVDNAIKNLDQKVSSGMMKLVDEKKALMEISSLKKTKKNIESFSGAQAAIDEDKAKVDKIRAELDDPEAKAINDKITAIRSELDAINKQHDEASKGRDVLFEERNAISKELDAVYAKKKESAAAWKEANNKFFQKRDEERQKRLERQRSERQQYEDSKRAEVNGRLLEEAQAPAFEREIEDCRTLIDFFQKRIGLTGSGFSTSGSTLYERQAVAGVPALDIRKVETGPPAGSVALKKKGEAEEEVFFVGKGKKGKKGPKPVKEEEKENTNQALNLPFGTLSALLTLGITSPLTTAEVPKTIEALEVKKKYFTDNQDRVTKERIAAVEKKIAAADAKSQAHANGNGTSSESAEAPAAAAEEETPKASEEEAKDESKEDAEEK